SSDQDRITSPLAVQVRRRLSHQPQRPGDDTLEYLGHRLVIAAYGGVDRPDVVFLLRPADSAEIQSRQTSLQSHQDREQSTATSIPFTKRVNQDEFRMHYGQCRCLLAHVVEPAWSVIAQRAALELAHQFRYLSGRREHELPFRQVHLSIFTSP